MIDYIIINEKSALTSIEAFVTKVIEPKIGADVQCNNSKNHSMQENSRESRRKSRKVAS